MRKRGFFSYFNTSHVTVYRNVLKSFSILDSFQYISCYCLSDATIITHFLVSISIHLMLLFIQTDGDYITYSWHFNTSHVTVYRWMLQTWQDAVFISIHLMLLFIGIEFVEISLVCKFQYISCYCLSRAREILKLSLIYFNTSHVTVYLRSAR